MTSRKIKTYADIGIEDVVDVEVEFDFQPEERMTRDYPGCPAYIEIISVIRGGVDITAFIDETEIQQIEQRIWDILNDEAYADQAEEAYDHYKDAQLEKYWRNEDE